MKAEDKRVPSALPGLGAARFFPWLVLGVCLVVSWLLWAGARQQSLMALQDYFDFRVRQAYILTEQRMLAQEQVLRGARGLFAASQSVERDEFRNYVASLHLEENYPDIQGVGFSVIVPPSEMNRHIARTRQESGRSEYDIDLKVSAVSTLPLFT